MPGVLQVTLTRMVEDNNITQVEKAKVICINDEPRKTNLSTSRHERNISSLSGLVSTIIGKLFERTLRLAASVVFCC